MNRPKLRIFLRFIIVGGVNTVFGWAVYSGAILYGLQQWQSLIVGMLAGICFNFVSLGGFVFRDMRVRRLPYFLVAYLVIYVFNLAGLEMIKAWINDPILAQLILAPPMALISFFLLSKKVFIGCERS